MASSETFRMTLTPEQKEQVRKSTGKEAEAHRAVGRRARGADRAGGGPPSVVLNSRFFHDGRASFRHTPAT